MTLRHLALWFTLPLLPISALAQASAVQQEAKPLPNLEALLATARARADANQELAKSYLCKQTVVADEFDSHANKKGTHTDVYEVFHVEKRELHRHILHDGKPLSEADAKKENERIDKLVADIKAGKVKDSKGGIVLRISSLLKLATVSEPRREMVNGRPTIYFHYKGNPKAKAGNIGEEVMKKLEGTVALDEEDAGIVHLDGTLGENFHVMGGLVINVKKGSSFNLDGIHIHDEIWFTHTIKYHVDGRLLLFKGFSGDGNITFSDYRKMKTSVTLLPGSRPVDENGKPIEEPDEAPKP